MLRFHWINMFFWSGRPDDHEGWRECLNQLCEKYLKNSEVKDINKIIFICWISGMVPVFFVKQLQEDPFSRVLLIWRLGNTSPIFVVCETALHRSAKHCAPTLRRWEAWVLVQSCWFWDRHGIRKQIHIGNEKQGSKQEGKKQEAGKEGGKEVRKEGGKEAGLERNRTGSGTCSFFKGMLVVQRAGGWLVVEEGAC